MELPVKTVLIVVLAVLPVSLAAAAAYVLLRPAADADWRVSAVHDAVRARLADPNSATFGPISFGAVTGGLAACGTVNAKNNLGGYVGQRPFTARNSTGRAFTVLLLAQSDSEASAIRQMCADDGMPVVP